jgi:copper resistance protein B
MNWVATSRCSVLCGCLLLLTVHPAVAQTDPHAGHQQPKPKTTGAEKPASAEPHKHMPAGDQGLPAFIPPITDEDRKAAFPEVQGHAVHDKAVNSFVLFDQLEWQAGDGPSGVNVDTRGWIGGDRNRLWFRGEGEGDRNGVGEAQGHLLYGRQFSRWWDLVVGVRQDVRPGPAQTWAAFGVQGLAPHWFEIEATGYIGAGGGTHARLEVEYELLLTNRLILQPLAEVEVFGKSDPKRGVGSGPSTTDVGFRLRYELRREFAPYVGVTWRNKWGKTADLAEAAGEETGGPRLVGGLRLWF